MQESDIGLDMHQFKDTMTADEPDALAGPAKTVAAQPSVVYR